MAVKIYLLDTNIVSQGIKPAPDASVLTALDAKAEFSAIGSPTWYELLKGAEVLPEDNRKSGILDFIYQDVAESFEILPYDTHAASLQASIFARMQEKGTPLPYTDCQLAAIALSNGLILVTGNTKHFEPIQKEFPLNIENWFSK